jgi:hydrogenase maturation protease
VDLQSRLRDTLTGRVCILGVGNVDRGDDAFGPRLAQELAAAGLPHSIDAGVAPETQVLRIARAGFDRVLFLDAVDVPGPAGSAVFLERAILETRFPQISTHRLSLGTLARILHEEGGVGSWLLGVKPASLAEGPSLSEPVERTLHILKEVLLEVLLGREAAAGAQGRAS